jgi:hypothetical protein
MSFNIPRAILKNTTKCRSDFSCISSEGKDLCQVASKLDAYDGNSILFCSPTNDQYCSYRKPFGEYCICGCPTRKAIHSRYQL